MQTRRLKGTGSVYKSGASYIVQRDLGIIDGTRRYRRWRFDSLKAAQAHLRRLQDTTAHGKPPTLAAYLARVLTAADTRLRPRTLRSYQRTVALHVTPFLGHVLVSDLTPTQIETWLQQLRARRRGTATVRYARVVLRTLLRPAQRDGYLSVNPAALASPPRHRARPIQPLTPDDATRLLAAVEGHWLAPIVLTMLALGLRLGEALALQWRDLDRTAGTLTIRRALQRVHVAKGPTKTKLLLADVKTDRARRTLHLPAVVADVLEAQRAESKPLRSKWIFCALSGGPREPRNVARAWQQVRALAQLPHLRLHDLRHSAATFALVLGLPPRAVADMLGHAETRTTLDIYTHVLPALKAGLAGQIDTLIRSIQPPEK